MANTEWNKLSRMQLGKYAEYYAKMEFASYGLDVYTSEVDDHGVDFIVKDKKSIVNYQTIFPLWNIASYETKCKFIYEYIDTIEIEKQTIKGSKEPKVKILGIQMKPNKIKKYFELKEKNMLDAIAYYNNTKFSIGVFNSEKEAIKYVDILSKKHNLKVVNIPAMEEYYYNSNILKIIKVNPKRAIEKPRVIYMELVN